MEPIVSCFTKRSNLLKWCTKKNKKNPASSSSHKAIHKPFYMCAAAEGIMVMLCKCRSHKMGSEQWQAKLGISAGAAGAAEDGSVCLLS